MASGKAKKPAPGTSKIASATKKKPTDAEILAKMGYTLGKLLGEGTYAKVMYAEYKDKSTGKKIPLACKVLSLKDASDSFVNKFFPRELAIMCKLDHQYVIRVHSILKETEKFYMFITFCENGDLLEFIRSHGAIREPQARTWFTQIIEAIEYLHNLDITHRDLKCENILLSTGFKVKIADFGFTRSFKDGDELSKTYCGSVMYAPPEVVRGIPYNPKMGDVWSMGVILYTMINSALPFEQNKGLTKLYDDQVKRNWKIRDKIKETISTELKVTVYHLLEPAPEKRLTVRQMKINPWILMGRSKPEQWIGKIKGFFS